MRLFIFRSQIRIQDVADFFKAYFYFFLMHFIELLFVVFSVVFEKYEICVKNMKYVAVFDSSFYTPAH